MPFSFQEDNDEDHSNADHGAKQEFQSSNSTNRLSEDAQRHLEELQNEALLKQTKRKQTMGELLRSKGFVWMATSNTYIGGWQQAGNILRVEVAGEWVKEKGEEKSTPQRQELVFIGMNLKHIDIQTSLDQCLLNDKEMKMSYDKWDEFMDAEDKIQCSLPVQLLFRPEDIIYIKRAE